MTFIHGYILGGLLLAGVPVLLHLLMRQKPRRIRFPAFRFLKARQRTNQRRMKLQHLLLLLLRILVIIAMCLALARPQVFAERGVSGDQAVIAVLIMDTSASMEYAVSGVTRLDESRRLAGALLDETADGSRVSILDSADDTDPPMMPPKEVLNRLESLKIRPGAGSLNHLVDRGLRLLEATEAEEAIPRILYIFTDRTRASWDASGRKPKIPEGVRVFLVDVGVESPRDLAIDGVEIFPPVVPPGGRYEVRVRIRGTPTGHESELSCVIDSATGDRVPERRALSLAKGVTSGLVVFDRTAPSLPPGQITDEPHQVTVQLATRDALLLNNSRYATFAVRGGRRLLTLVEQKGEHTTIWEAVHNSTRSFSCEVKTFAEANQLLNKDLSNYAVVTLLHVRTVPESWWKKLADYTKTGGGLAIVPTGEEANIGQEEMNRLGLGTGLFPASLERLADAPAGEVLRWERFRGSHALIKPFVDWSRAVDPDFDREETRPFVRRFWRTGKLANDSIVVASFADPGRSPALLERSVGKGKSVMFTSPLDFRWVDEAKTKQWNNYWSDSSFGLVLVDRVCRYLGGEVRFMNFNFVCGQAPELALAVPPASALTLVGPGLAPAERTLRAALPGMGLRFPQAVLPGNYQVHNSDQVVGAFSVNLANRETYLERIAVTELEEALGKGIVIQPGQAELREALGTTRSSPIELLPFLMLSLLIAMTLESFLANRFYRGQGQEPTEQPGTMLSIEEKA